MTQFERLRNLNQYLLAEAPGRGEWAAGFAADEEGQFRLFRSLVNLRLPKPASREFLALQDEYLSAALGEKGITDGLAPVEEGLYLWQGDITTLAADAIVNAANSRMLGCFCPCHGCIDNAIHTFSGVQLRLACAALMARQGREEPPGQAKITPAFNLPSRYVIHTVGPIVNGRPTEREREQLASCYRSCLALAERQGCASIAFCCLSTGEFHFPNAPAAEIAIRTVREYKRETNSQIKVIFDVFKRDDYHIYRDILGRNQQAEK